METTEIVETTETTASAANVAAPDFAEEWKQIRADLEKVAAGRLRIGQNLIKIRDALKPRGLWLPALREHGMSQPQASRYIRFAEMFAKMSERDREIFLRAEDLSLSEAVGEGRREPSDYSSTNSRNSEDEVEVPADELEDRRAEVKRRIELTYEVVDAIERTLARDPLPGYDDDAARWESDLHEVVDVVRAILDEYLVAELKRRLLPC